MEPVKRYLIILFPSNYPVPIVPLQHRKRSWRVDIFTGRNYRQFFDINTESVPQKHFYQYLNYSRGLIYYRPISSLFLSKDSELKRNTILVCVAGAVREKKGKTETKYRSHRQSRFNEEVKSFESVSRIFPTRGD